VSEQEGMPGEPTGAASSQPQVWRQEPHHFWRMISIWVVLSIVGDLIFWFVAGPHVPPGDMGLAAKDDQFDFNVLFMVALPIILAVWTYFGYAIVMWRARPGTPEPVGGPQARSNLPVQIAWIATTAVLILFAFLFGTIELITTAGAGGGEGPNPIWKPTSKTILPIQVIAQQWKFTFRYPTYGGMETSDLVLPNDTTIAFHVTSIDVIHDFWAYQLGVKADANPEVTNTAYTVTRQLGRFTVRCDELCGIWHGAMYDYGKVVTKAQFTKWASSTESRLADNTKYLPPFAWTYSPTANGPTGVTSEDTSGQAPYSKIQKYGATTAAQKVVKRKAVTPTTTGT